MIKGMKKIISVFLIFLLTSNCVLAEEVARLYTVKDTDTAKAAKVIRPMFNMTGFRTIADDNFYIIENPSLNIYHVIIIKPNGTDCYYYYLSNDDASLNKRILENFDSYNIETKRIRNSAFLLLFHSEAAEFLANSSSGIKAVSNVQEAVTLQPPTQEDYDFSDEAQARFDNRTSAITPQTTLKLPGKPVIRLENQNVLKGSVVHVDAGQQFNAVLSSTISSDSITNNDNISALLESDWTVNGTLIAPAGSIVSGNVVDSRAATFAMGDGKIGLNFNKIMTPDGKVIPLTTNEVYIVGDSPRAKRIAGRVAGGALGGLLIGALFLLGGADPTGALVSGAAIGGAFGAASAVAQKGEEVYVPEGTVLQIMLAEPMTAQPYYRI